MDRKLREVRPAGSGSFQTWACACPRPGGRAAAAPARPLNPTAPLPRAAPTPLRPQLVFKKRKNGVMRRAMELSVLCDCDVAVVLFDSRGRLYQYASGPMEALLTRYGEACTQPHESHTTEDVSGRRRGEGSRGGGGLGWGMC